MFFVFLFRVHLPMGNVCKGEGKRPKGRKEEINAVSVPFLNLCTGHPAHNHQTCWAGARKGPGGAFLRAVFCSPPPPHFHICGQTDQNNGFPKSPSSPKKMPKVLLWGKIRGIPNLKIQSEIWIRRLSKA